MAITTLDGIISGATIPVNFYKAGTTTVAGRLYSLLYAGGLPGSASGTTIGIAGAALTAYTGQIPFTNPTAGQNTYLSKFSALSNSAGTLLLCDRLWQNSGVLSNTTTVQTVNSVAFAARDINQSINGEGCLIGVEVTSATTSVGSTVSIGYTSSNNVQATGTTSIGATSLIGAIYPIAFVSGHTGAKEVRNFSISSIGTTGNFSLVCYRILASVDIGAGFGNQVDAITSGFPRLFDNTVPFLIFMPVGTTAPAITGQIIFTKG